MRNRFLLAALTLAAVFPTLAMAQAAPAERAGSWELSAGVGAMHLGDDLATFLGSHGFADNGATPSQWVPTIVLGVGYNINRHLGLNFGSGGATGSGVKYVTPFADVVYTVNLNAKTSPFIAGGTQFTRITGNNGRVTHPTYGLRLGVGVRHMLSENLALRAEGRMGFEHYEELPGAKSANTPVLTIGVSYFTPGHRPPPPPAPVAPTPCPVCVQHAAPPPPPPPAHVCTNGVAPAGAPLDKYGCLIFRDSLLFTDVHFDFDKSDLTPTAKSILDRVAESMAQYPELYFEIAGHTDSVGTFAYNYLLSARRAVAVRDYLISRGVPFSHMTAVGYGEEFPIAPNASVEGRALNRRGLELRVKKLSR